MHIPKEDGSKRPLTVANPRDKLIQQAFLQVMQPLWEGCTKWKESTEEEFLAHKQEYVSKVPRTVGRTVIKKKDKAKYYIKD